MVIGEGAAGSEGGGGAPSIGRSGRLLVRLIEEEVGLTRADCFITNVVKCRPPANRTPRREEIEACHPWLIEQLALVRPRVVLALGNTAARAVFGFSKGIGRTHGRIQSVGSAWGLATSHQAAARRGGPSVVDVLRVDLRRVKDLVERS